MNMKSFEEKVLEGLIYSLSDSKVSLDDCNSIGVAVSGGADSISLLCALNNILPKSITLKAVTVNHNIRAPEETAGSAGGHEGAENRKRPAAGGCHRK